MLGMVQKKLYRTILIESLLWLIESKALEKFKIRDKRLVLRNDNEQFMTNCKYGMKLLFYVYTQLNA